MTSEGVLGDECIITPEGFGFSAPARRVLKEANRSTGFYKASGKELVIDVMDAITSGEGTDVALVYGEDDKVMGLFTESDYIKVSRLHLHRSLGIHREDFCRLAARNDVISHFADALAIPIYNPLSG